MALPKINLPPIKTKYKIIGLFGIAALIFGYYYDHLYKPHAKAVSAIRTDLKSLEETIKIVTTLEYPQVTSNKEIVNKIKEKKEQSINKILSEETRLPTKAAISSMLEKITRLADQTGVEIKSLEPKDFTVRGVYACLPLELEINSTYSNLVLFLEKMKELPVSPESIKLIVRSRPLLNVHLYLYIFVK